MVIWTIKRYRPYHNTKYALILWHIFTGNIPVLISTDMNMVCSVTFSYIKSQYLFFLKVLVLGNKRDLPNALDEKQLIEKMYVLRMNNGV